MLHTHHGTHSAPSPTTPGTIEAQLHLADRSTPSWATFLGAMFTLGGSLCLLALILLLGLFQTIVAIDGEINMVPILLGVACVLLLGVLLFEFSHIRALAGFRLIRERNAIKFRAWAALPATLILTFIHPLCGIAIPISIAVGYACLKVLPRWSDQEPEWDFLPDEAVAIFSGRDKIGGALASQTAHVPPLSFIIAQCFTALSVVCSIAICTYLTARGILALSALLPIALATLIVVHAALIYAQQHLSERLMQVVPEAAVTAAHTSAEDDGDQGLDVSGLTLRNAKGEPLLSEVTFNVSPGSLTGIIGDSGAGKSLLLQVLSDPFSLLGMGIRGRVRINGSDPWERQALSQHVPSVLVNAETIFLPASGLNNLTSFHSDTMEQRGKCMLEQWVFSTDTAEDICVAQDARQLPSMYQKTLALARAFLLSPAVYLLDRPEEGLPDAQIAALLDQIKREKRLGKAIVLVTNNRALLEACDRLITMQSGRIVDFGPAEQVRQRMETGWMRFVGERRLEIEGNLESWIRSHFRRDGEEGNRRKACAVALELLALSCQTADPLRPDTLSVSFKHFEGFCLIKLKDRGDPIGAAQMELARQQVESKQTEGGLPPLAVLSRESIEVLCDTEGDHRVIQAKVETYDPRKLGTKQAATQGARVNEAAEK